jgi:hypothetical protein
MGEEGKERTMIEEIKKNLVMKKKKKQREQTILVLPCTKT